MKHFVTLAALLTSVSAVAQLPYNPDANNDGQISVYDLTSVLSVYGGSFSSQTQLALHMSEYYPDYDVETAPSNASQWWCESSEPVYSWLVDFNQHQLGVLTDASIIINHTLVNGMSVTVLAPENNGQFCYVSVLSTTSDDHTDFNYYGSQSRVYKLVYWNGEWYRDM